MEANDRIEQFREDAAKLDLRTGSQSRDGIFQTAGLVLMMIAFLVSFIAYQASLNSDDPRDIQSLIILAIAMLVLAVLGGAVFLRYSMARFLRFWLLRQLYEGQANVDRVVEAVNRR
jgi:hypothetical protein